MEEEEKSDYLSEDQKNHYQQRIAHYLKGYRLRNSLTGVQMAKQMGLSIATFRSLEGTKPPGRVVNSLEFLASLYTLEKMTLADFCIYLDSTGRGEKSDELSLRRKLFPWEKHLLESFENIGMIYRREFVSICSKTSIEKYIGIILKLHRLDSSELDTIEKIADSILKYKDIESGD